MTRLADYVNVAASLRTLRKARNMTLEDVASRAGCSRSNIYEIETRGTPNPTINTVIALADCFGLTVSEFLGELEPPYRTDIYHALMPYLK